MKLLALFEGISNRVDRMVRWVLFLLILGMITAITLQILFRVFFDSLVWTEEISRYLLVWSTFLGATMAYYRGMHINVTFVVDAMPQKIQKSVQTLAILASMVFFALAIKYGIDYMTIQIFQVSAALRVPMKWVYLVMPLSFAIMFLHGLTGITRVWVSQEAGETP